MLLFSFLIQLTGGVCMVLALLWNRRRGRADWSERALALKAPVGAEQRRVRPYLRDGGAAPDPELAYLTVRVAEQRRRQMENPWHVTEAGLFLFGTALAMVIRSVQSGYPGLVWFGLTGLALAVCGPFLRQLTLSRMDRALAANRDLAARYEVPEEEPPPPPRER